MAVIVLELRESTVQGWKSKVVQTVCVGVGATAVMDVGAEIVRAVTGVPPLNYALVGRWVGHMPGGIYQHDSIVQAPEVAHEKLIGWAAHYAIGTGLVAALVSADPKWLDRPAFAPAMTVGIATVAAPWFVMQPAFGLGMAASKTPNPTRARLRSLRAHAIYGLGVWLSGNAVRTARLLVAGR